MKHRVLDILKGTFLVSGDAPRNWRFIVFVSLLATAMIGSSHSADRKVHRIAALNEAVKELRSQFVDIHKDVQHLRLESTIRERMAVRALYPSEVPPTKIRIRSTAKEKGISWR